MNADRGLRKVGLWIASVVIPIVAIAGYFAVERVQDQARETARRDALRSLIVSLATDTLQQEAGEGVVESDVPEGTLDETVDYRWGKKRDDGSAAGFQCVTKRVDIEQQSEEFITLNPTAEWLYPGALLQGSTIQGGTPTWVNAGRSGGIVQLAAETGADTAYTQPVERVGRATVGQAMNDILSRYDGSTPGQLVITQERIDSQEHLEAMLGVNVTGIDFSGGTSLAISGDREKSRLLFRLKQTFYTMVYAPPRHPEDVFARDVQADELRRWMGPGNPPVYVSSVNYGRMLIAILESDLSYDELEAKFEANYKAMIEAEATGETKYSNRIKNTSVKVIALGGSGKGSLGAGADVAQDASLDGIYEFLRSSGDFGSDNPGVPISYHMRSLSDSRPVRLAATTEFMQYDCSPAVMGCDGKLNSTVIVDECGVCGGANRCKRPCSPKKVILGNDYVFVILDLPKTKVGGKISYSDGAKATYHFPRCYRVVWSATNYTCVQTPNGGRWKESKDWARDALCHNSGTTDQDHMRVCVDSFSKCKQEIHR